MQLKVFKFGGALLNNIEGFKQLNLIVQNEKQPTIIVISAFQKTTSHLLKAAKTAEICKDDALKIIDEIFEYHYSIALELIPNQAKTKTFITEKKEQVSKIISGISITKELTARTKDLVLSFGEMLASRIVSDFLTLTNSKVTIFDITEVLVTDSNYGAAIPNISETQKRINEKLIPIIKSSNCIVTQGFIAANSANEITTMGYESSNLTATILAGLLDISEFVIWSDTEGIRYFDPKFAKKNSPLVKTINYDFAEFLAFNGLKVIHPPMIDYLRQFHLSVEYRSGYEPEGSFTKIEENAAEPINPFLIHSKEISIFYNYDYKNRKNYINKLNYIVKSHSEGVYIYPNNNLFVTNKASFIVENELLTDGFRKIDDVQSLTIINVSYLETSFELMKILNNYVNDVEILEIVADNIRKSIRIFFKTTNINFIEDIFKYFECNCM